MRLLPKRLSRREDPSEDLAGLPAGADWRWQPVLWSGETGPFSRAELESGTPLAPGISVYHDTAQPLPSCTLELPDQTPPTLRVDTAGFAGSFLSLAVDIPAKGHAGPALNRLYAFEVTVTADIPVAIYFRLNLRQGPNTGHMLQSAPGSGPVFSTEFDVLYGQFPNRPVDAMWVDLIVENPGDNRFSLSSFTATRSFRAGF